MSITRTADTDDDGTGTTGTIHNNAWKTNLYDAIDTALGAQGTWAAWVPTWTNLTKGSATITARYNQVGKRVIFYLEMVWAGDTSSSGVWEFSLPVQAKASTGCGTGGGSAVDTGTASFPVAVEIGSTTAYISNYTVSGSNVIRGQVATTVPFTWTTNDVLRIAGYYEAL